MPVPVTQSNFKLDSIISTAPAELATDDAGDPYTVRRVGGTEAADLGPLILDWAAVPVEGDVNKWFLYNVIEAQQIQGTAFYAALDGVFAVETALEIGDTPCDITSFEVPVPTDGNRARFSGISGLRDLPTLEEDGDALFSNARLGTPAAPFDLVSFDLTLRVGLTVYSGVVANVTPEADFPAGTSEVNAQNPRTAQIGLTASGGINLQLGAIHAIWAQEFDRSVSPLDAPDGIEAAETIFEETVTWIVREKIPVSNVILVGTLRYGISEVQPLSRGRYWSVTATRRYSGVSL